MISFKPLWCKKLRRGVVFSPRHIFTYYTLCKLKRQKCDTPKKRSPVYIPPYYSCTMRVRCWHCVNLLQHLSSLLNNSESASLTPLYALTSSCTTRVNCWRTARRTSYSIYRPFSTSANLSARCCTPRADKTTTWSGDCSPRSHTNWKRGWRVGRGGRSYSTLCSTYIV